MRRAAAFEQFIWMFHYCLLIWNINLIVWIEIAHPKLFCVYQILNIGAHISIPNSKSTFKKSNIFHFDMPILSCSYLIEIVSKFSIHRPCANFSISYSGAIVHPYITSAHFCTHPPTKYVSINTVLNVSKNDHFLNLVTPSKCWCNIWMALRQDSDFSN